MLPLTQWWLQFLASILPDWRLFLHNYIDSILLWIIIITFSLKLMFYLWRSDGFNFKPRSFLTDAYFCVTLARLILPVQLEEGLVKVGVLQSAGRPDLKSKRKEKSIFVKIRIRLQSDMCTTATFRTIDAHRGGGRGEEGGHLMYPLKRLWKIVTLKCNKTRK